MQLHGIKEEISGGAGSRTGIVTETGSTEGSKTDTDIVIDTGSDSAVTSKTGTDNVTVTATNTGSNTVTDIGSDTTMASKTDTASVTAKATDTGSDSAVGSTKETDTVTDNGGNTAVQTDTGIETDTAVPTDTETETDPNKRCGAERVDCTVTEQICNAEGICEPKPCQSNTDCPSPGYECNIPWGYCAVSSCTGHGDFTRCTLVTGEPDRSYDICVNQTCRSPGCGEASCNVPYPYFPLPDTGQKECYDNGAMLTSCSVSEDFLGQDAQYGWDTDPTGPRFTRDESSSEPVVTGSSGRGAQTASQGAIATPTLKRGPSLLQMGGSGGPLRNPGVGRAR